MAKRAVVVGAGAAGLAAATRLADAAWQVTVVEAEVPGGKARTLQASPGWWIEWGPHSLTSRATSVFAWAERLGVEPVPALEHARRRFVVLDGRLVAVPAGLSWAQWRGVACGLVRAVDDEPGATLRAWVAGRFGAAMAGEVLDAATSGIWACSPDEIEAESAFPWLIDALRVARRPIRLMGGRRGGRKGTWTVRGGLGGLTEAARRLMGDRVVSGRVDGLADERGAWRVSCGDRAIPADAVVLATDAVDAAALLRGVVPEAARLASQVRYAALAVLHVRVRGSNFPPSFGFLAPPGSGLGLLGAIVVSCMLPDRAPAGETSFAVMFGGTRAPADVELPDEVLLDRFVRAHHRLAGQAPEVLEHRVIRHARAVAIPGPGHRARLAALRAALPEGLAVAGAWCGAGSLEDAVRSGNEAAERVVGADQAGGPT